MAALLDYPRAKGSEPRLPTGDVRRYRQSLWLPSLACLVVLGLETGFWLAGAGGGADTQKEPFQEFYQSFKGPPWDPQLFKVAGRDAEQCVRSEPAGLRITLPAGVPGEYIWKGLVALCVVQGDFEITVNYEILKEPEAPEARHSARFSLGISLDKPKKNMASFSRQVSPKFARTQFLTWLSLWNEAAGKDQTRADVFPTLAKSGQLRLVRSGDILSYHAAEGFDREFTRLQEYPLGKEDLKEVRVGGATDGPEASLDVRVFDLRIRAAALPTLPVASIQRPGMTLRSGWLAAGTLVGSVLLLTIGLWLYLRQKDRPGQRSGSVAEPAHPTRPEAAGSVSFSCSDCGKPLKTRADLASKKIKCPQCGQAQVVPQTEAGGAAADPA
jgi:hypothetical protein